MSLRLIACLLLLALYSCRGRVDPGLEMVEANGTMIPKINVEQIEKENIILFSDWFEDIRLIELEVTENSLIDRVLSTFVGYNYIIVSTMRSGILQFSLEGKFIKSMARKGKGPGELFELNSNFFVDEPNDKVYIYLGYSVPDKVLCVDIPSGEFEYISYANTGTELIGDPPVVRDTIMYCATINMRRQKLSNPLFCQSTSGNLIWEFKTQAPEGLFHGRAYLIENRVYFKYSQGDILYQLQDRKITPHMIITSTSPKAIFPKAKENSIAYGIQPILKNWFLGYYQHLTEVDYEQVKEGFPKISYSPITRFLYNQKKNQVYRIGESFINDYLGTTERFDLNIQSNGIAFAKYQALDLYEYADSASQSSETDPKVKERLNNILNIIEADGNPCLLIGKMKNGIKNR